MATDYLSEREMRWAVLVPTALLLGFAMLFAELRGWWGAFPARPDLLWCLAFLAGLRTGATPCIVAFALCGMVRDLFLGPKLGASAIAYVLVGWIFLYWRPLADARGWLMRAFMAGVGACMVAVVKRVLDYGDLSGALWERIAGLAAGDGVLTALVFIPAVVLLHAPSFRPWRDRSGY